MSTTSQTVQSAGGLPAAQEPSSSTVLEFVCLFTHDLKRKQKRWQDGRLKLHTFNKRIMVYDDRGNFIGDTHWREDYEFGDGEEFQLERGSVLVQAAECIANHRQDLSELIDKRVHERAQRQSAAAARPPAASTPARSSVASPRPGNQHFQLRHTPLLSVLGTPTGHHGRALASSKSPFEQRQKLIASEGESPNPAKRRRREISPSSKSGYATSLFGAQLSLSGQPRSSAPLLRRPRGVQTQPAEQPPPHSSDLSVGNSDTDDMSSVFAQSKPRDHSIEPPAERRTQIMNTPTAEPRASFPPLLRQRKPETGHQPALTGKQISGPPSRGDDLEICGSNDQPRAKTRLPQKAPERRAMETSTVSPAIVDLTDDAGNSTQSHVSKRKKTKETLRPPAKRARSPARAEISSPAPPRAKSPARAVIEPPPPPQHEHRIELRMAPARKRGLLFLAGKTSTKKHRPATEDNNDLSSQTEPIPSGNRDISPKPQTHHKETPGEVPALTLTDSVRPDESIAPDVIMEADEAALPVSPQQSIEILSKSDTNDQSSRPNTVFAKTDTLSSRQSQYADADFDEILSRRPQNAPPPRLAKLRKSVRSREVIGLFEEPEPPPVEADTEEAQPVAPRVMNPATRGKKAAQPSDAAGQAAEPGIPTDNRIGCPAPRPTAPAPALVALPGFSRANGGPWSREAYDLFDYKRPEDADLRSAA